MIVEGLLNIVFGSVSGLFGLLPDISWNVDSSASIAFLDLISIVLYLFPMGTLFSCIGMFIVLNNLKIIISIIRGIWDLLPFV